MRDHAALSTPDVSVTSLDGHVAQVEITRPPANYFDVGLLEAIGNAYNGLEQDPDVRAVVLASAGRHFCAGADFSGRSDAASFDADEGSRMLYAAGHRLFTTTLPVIAAVQGTAVGGGLGLALTADLRVAGPASRFVANFAKLGLHHGFALSVTLPRVVGAQVATDLLMTGRPVEGTEAYQLRLCDRLVPDDEVRDGAVELARELAAAAPVALQSIRRTLRHGLAEAVAAAVDHERTEQSAHRRMADFAEGVAAAAERRPGRFTGR